MDMAQTGETRNDEMWNDETLNGETQNDETRNNETCNGETINDLKKLQHSVREENKTHCIKLQEHF